MKNKTRKNNKKYRNTNKKGYKTTTNNKGTKKFIKLNCSPENKGKQYTCYTDTDLFKLREMWKLHCKPKTDK